MVKWELEARSPYSRTDVLGQATPIIRRLWGAARAPVKLPAAPQLGTLGSGSCHLAQIDLGGLQRPFWVMKGSSLALRRSKRSQLASIRAPTTRLMKKGLVSSYSQEQEAGLPCSHPRRALRVDILDALQYE